MCKRVNTREGFLGAFRTLRGVVGALRGVLGPSGQGAGLKVLILRVLRGFAGEGFRASWFGASGVEGCRVQGLGGCLLVIFGHLIGVLSDSDPNSRRLLRFYGSSEGMAGSSVERVLFSTLRGLFLLGVSLQQKQARRASCVARSRGFTCGARASRPFACGSGIVQKALVSKI